MATRIYTKVSGAVGATPSDWEFANQASPVTVPGTTVKNDGSAMTSKAESTGANPSLTAMGRTILGPLAGQSIAGTISGQMRGLESNTGANASLALAVKLIQPDGTDRSILLAPTAADAATAGHEFVATTLTNSVFENASEVAAIPLTTQTATSGDYLVIEWGFRSATTAGRTITLSYGNDNATDLTAGDTTETTAFNPWWEFSQTLTFPLLIAVTDALTVVDSPTLSLPATAVTDALTVADSVTAVAMLGVSVTDGIALKEALASTARKLAGSSNATVSFLNMPSLSIPDSAHGIGHAAILTQAYDAAAPAAMVTPGRVTVDASTFAVSVLFAQPQSGILVLNGGIGTTMAVPITATANTPFSITQATHGLSTANIITQVYNNATPAAIVTPGSVTVNRTTGEVIVTFRQDFTGVMVLGDSTNIGPPHNVAAAVTASAGTPFAITNGTHGLGTKNLLVQVYDNGTPRVLVEPGSMTVHPTTFEVTLVFSQALTGTAVLNGTVPVEAGAAPAIGSLAMAGVGL